MPVLHTYKEEVLREPRQAVIVAAAEYLAKTHNRRVLLVDWDLSVSASRSFFPAVQPAEKTMIDLLHHFQSKGYRKFLSDKISIPIQKKDLEACIVPYLQLPSNGRIDVLPASNDTEDHKHKIKHFEWLPFYKKFNGEAFIMRTKAALKEMDYDDIFIYKMPGFYGDYNLFEGRFTIMMVDFWLDFMQSDRDFETKICYENVFLEATIYEYDEVSEQLSDAYRILGNLYAAQKLYEKAIENYRAALRIRQQIFGSRHQYTRQICGEMADLYAQNGDVDIAKDYKDFSEGIG